MQFLENRSNLGVNLDIFRKPWIYFRMEGVYNLGWAQVRLSLQILFFQLGFYKIIFSQAYQLHFGFLLVRNRDLGTHDHGS